MSNMTSNRQISATMFGYVCDNYNQQPMVRELTTPRIRSDNEVLVKVKIAATMFGYVCDDYKQQPMVRELTTPRIRSDNEVLIKVKASSVNPIDIRTSEGYVHQLMTAVNNLQERRLTGSSRLPTTLGRDFSGVVAELGNIKKAIVLPATPGAHSEYVITNTDYTIPKPKTVDHVNAAAMIYTTATAWSALTTADLECLDYVLTFGAKILDNESASLEELEVAELATLNCNARLLGGKF
ncbi:unnamed protein product [Bursaphelenchus okinawaensis]|uniref:Alcohol dehydrogenase-like N-terminal domain-containing protein n=1 Tax=Bursaphelenchus okinawaensis TaxID=465554 RepID=A0A811JUS0_9BILA|nr:unnamed protein product [Bursaphelenchus okinawaensis]CAG9084051.1 unnamed protein product [Bursaphelenchus okinawaensis]